MKPHFILLFCVFAFTSLEVVGQCAPSLYFRDDDGDGHGIGTNTEISAVYADYYTSGNNGTPVLHTNVYMGCTPPGGWSKENNDIDDTNLLITNLSPQNFYFDSDGDGFGATIPFVNQSHAPSGYVSNNTDCDDSNPDIRPNLDWYLDEDGDGVGSDEWILACYQPDGYVAIDGDECDDNDTTLVQLTWYLDEDGDGFAGGTSTILACTAPPNYYATADDCDDNNSNLHPNTLWYHDRDGDGFGSSDFVQNCIAPLGTTKKTAFDSGWCT